MTPLTPPAVPTATPVKPKFNFPLPIIGVVGPSGSGKTSSYKDMPMEETLIIDCERKGFPFQTSGIVNYVETATPMAVEQAINKIKANPGKIKYVILDSFYKYMEMQILECKTTFKNYDIYNNYTARIREFLKGLKQHKLIFILICVDEVVVATDEENKTVSYRRIQTFGRELEAKLELEFLIVLFTSVRKKATGKEMDYMFLTNTDGIASAKSPAGMLPAMYVPNDLSAVVKALDKVL